MATILRVAGVVPEPHRHRRERRRAHELALELAAGRDRLAVVVVDVDLHAETAALQLAAPHRQRRATEREAGHDVGAPGDRRQAEIALHALVDVIEALRRERAAGREQRPQIREREVLARDDADLLRVVDVLGRRAEVRGPLGFGEIPQHLAAVDEGRPVVEQQRRARAEARGEPVPHHPAAGREIEQPVAGLEVAVQQVLLQVLQQRAAGAVDDALRNAGRSRREENVERMVERQADVVDRDRRRAARGTHPRRPRRGRARRPAGPCPVASRYGITTTRSTVGSCATISATLSQDRQRLAVVPVAVDGDEHARLDLAEAIEHALHAEVRRAGRPDRAKARRAQHRLHRLGHVGNVGGHPVARGHARGLQRGGHPRRRRHEFRVRHAAGELVLAAEDQRVAGVVGRAPGEQVLGEVQARVGKPSGARHPGRIDERALAARADDAGIVPDFAPERLALLVRPAPERGVIGTANARTASPRAGRIR